MISDGKTSSQFINNKSNLRFLTRRGLIETAPFGDDNSNHYRSTKQPHSSRGAYEALEVDETPLLEQEEEENVLFSKA